jgi:hypothetical protein
VADPPNPKILRVLSFVVLILGAVGSLEFVLNAGRQNRSFILIALFAIWTLSPFLGLLAINAIIYRWPPRKRFYFYLMMFVLTTVALVSYSGLIRLPGARPAFIFLVVPLVSWLAIIITLRLSEGKKA